MKTQDYNNRKFMIFNTTELANINFEQVLETSQETVRKSVDETKTFVKWDDEIPQCVLDLSTKQGPYTYEEMLDILSTEEWSPIMEEI